jgi:hypothetical protein
MEDRSGIVLFDGHNDAVQFIAKYRAGGRDFLERSDDEGLRDGRLGEPSPKKGAGRRGRAALQDFRREGLASPPPRWSILYRLRSADGRTLALIEPSSQADLAFNPTYRPEPNWVSVTSHRNTSGERKPHGITCNAEG